MIEIYSAFDIMQDKILTSLRVISGSHVSGYVYYERYGSVTGALRQSSYILNRCRGQVQAYTIDLFRSESYGQTFHETHNCPVERL
jgi:esterase/lipase superfamily enzyme